MSDFVEVLTCRSFSVGFVHFLGVKQNSLNLCVLEAYANATRTFHENIDSAENLKCVLQYEQML